MNRTRGDGLRAGAQAPSFVAKIKFAASSFVRKSSSCNATVMGDFIAVDFFSEVCAGGKARSEANP
jgi:hypothetical protein